MEHLAPITDDFLRWCTQQAELLRTSRFGQVDALGLAEELERMARAQINQLHSSYRLLCRHLLARPSQESGMEPADDLVIFQERAIIAQLLTISPSLASFRDDLLRQAYEDERRKLAAEANVAIASAKFPKIMPFSVDEAESHY